MTKRGYIFVQVGGGKLITKSGTILLYLHDNFLPSDVSAGKADL